LSLFHCCSPDNTNQCTGKSVYRRKQAPIHRCTSNRNSADTSPNKALPELQQLAPNFLATFLVVTFQNNNRHMHRPFTQPLLQPSYSLILPLRQPIRPFTTNNALSVPPCIPRYDPFLPVCPYPVGESGSGGWSAPALNKRQTVRAAMIETKTPGGLQRH